MIQHATTGETERFFRNVSGSHPLGCWVWTGTTANSGYGAFKPERRGSTGAHRWVYETLVSRISDGAVIDHLCRNKVCVNPAHLEQVSPRENTRRSRELSAADHFALAGARGGTE